jgi:hypothetical protein
MACPKEINETKETTWDENVWLIAAKKLTDSEIDHLASIFHNELEQKDRILASLANTKKEKEDEINTVKMWCFRVGSLMDSIDGFLRKEGRGSTEDWYDPEKFYENRHIIRLIEDGTGESKYDSKIREITFDVRLSYIIRNWINLLGLLKYDRPEKNTSFEFLSPFDQEKLFNIDRRSGVTDVTIEAFLNKANYALRDLREAEEKEKTLIANQKYRITLRKRELLRSVWQERHPNDEPPYYFSEEKLDIE